MRSQTYKGRVKWGHPTKLMKAYKTSNNTDTQTTNIVPPKNLTTVISESEIIK